MSINYNVTLQENNSLTNILFHPHVYFTVQYPLSICNAVVTQLIQMSLLLLLKYYYSPTIPDI